MKKYELQDYVDKLNNRYCKSSKNKFEIEQAYGRNYSVVLTGKRNKNGKPVKGSLGTGQVCVGNDWHDSVENTLKALYRADYRGWIKDAVKYSNKK